MLRSVCFFFSALTPSFKNNFQYMFFKMYVTMTWISNLISWYKLSSYIIHSVRLRRISSSNVQVVPSIYLVARVTQYIALPVCLSNSAQFYFLPLFLSLAIFSLSTLKDTKRAWIYVIRGQRALTVTGVSKTLHWLLVWRAHIWISVASSGNKWKWKAAFA